MVIEYVIACKCENKTHHYTTLQQLSIDYENVSQNICESCKSEVKYRYITVCGNKIRIDKPL